MIYFFRKFFKILPIADWSENKRAQKSLLTPEIEPHDLIILKKIFFNCVANQKMVVKGTQNDKHCQFKGVCDSDLTYSR